MQEIDLKSIAVLLLSRLKWIIVSIAVGLLVFGVYAYAFVPEQYTASALVYVRNTKDDYDNNSNGTTAGNLTAAQQLVANFSVHMKTTPVLEAASAKTGGKVTAAQIKKASSAAAVDETSWLKVSVTMNDANLAMETCNAIAEASAEKFVELEASSAFVRDRATKATQTAPNITRTALLGALVGLALSVGFILLRQFTDNTIRDKRSLQMRLEVPVLGEIPSFDLASQKKKKGGSYYA